MNKKITLYLLIALIAITNSSYAKPIIHKYDIEETLAFWTPERMKNSKPLAPKNTGFRVRNKKRSKAKTIRNASNETDSINSMPPFARQYDNPNSAMHTDVAPNYPVGILFANDPVTGKLVSCTACVINTDNGNIGATAAHCLFNEHGQLFNNLMFSPGYDHGQNGPLGQIPVAVAQVTDEFRADNDNSDYGLMRFAFNDPGGQGRKLQQFTGAHGWKFDVGTDIPTVIQGYPFGGDFEDCPNDGQNLCHWDGETELEAKFYVITDENLGTGASGAPFIMNYDPNTNLGHLYGNVQAYDRNNEETVSPIYSQEDFNVLVGYVSDH